MTLIFSKSVSFLALKLSESEIIRVLKYSNRVIQFKDPKTL
jgi:hypothetical protein